MIRFCPTDDVFRRRRIRSSLKTVRRSAHFIVGSSTAIPFADDKRGCGVKAGHAIEPADTGVEREVLGLRVVPGDLGRQAAHGDCTGEAAVDKQGTTLLEQLNHAVEALVGDVG